MPAYSRILLPWDSQPQEAVGVANTPARRVFSYLASNPGVALLGGAPTGGSGIELRGAGAAGLAVGASGTGGRYWTGIQTGTDYTVMALVDFYTAGNATHEILDSDSSTSADRTFLFRVELTLDAVEFIPFNTAGSAFTVDGTTSMYGIGPAVVVARLSGTEATVWVNGKKEGTGTITGTARSLDASKQLWLANTGRSQLAPNSNSIFAADLFDGALPDAFLSGIRTPQDYYGQLFAPRSIWVPVSAAGGGYTLTADAGAYTLSGQSATITRSRALTADAGSYTLSGQAATITRNRALTASSGAYTLSGQAATITYTPGSGTTYTLTASAGAYTLGGQTASLLYGRLLVAGSGSYSVAGQDATITYTPAALPTVGRPASDASNAGWTASTGSDLYAMLDEVTPDSADYIVTTSTGSICEMPLQTTAYPGTAAQKLSYRASSSTGNSVIVRLKNTGGATVRTETQVLTASDTLYEITLTAPEIAAITSGALSVELESA